jgi:hypothetical protein
VHLKWDIPDVPSQRRRNGLYLPLSCKECGRQRVHFTEYVLVDINSMGNDEPRPKYDAHILDHEVVCPKCGAADRYKLTPVAYLRIAGPEAITAIAREQIGEKTKQLTPNPRVFYFRSVVFGQPMHPLDRLEQYRSRIAANPGDALLHSKMGSLLRVLLRYEEALKAQRHAYQLAPDDPEVIIRLAFSEHDFGDREAARQLYQKVIDLSSSRKLFSKPDDNYVGALRGIYNLKRNRSSPTEMILSTSDGKPVEHPFMLKGQSHAKSFAQTPKGKKSKRSKRRRRRRK